MANNTNSKNTDSKIIVALDYADAASALNLVNQLDPNLCKLKVGKELFTAAGPQFVEKLVAKKACQAASNLGVWMLNVHASGGTSMMHAAAEGVDIGSQGSEKKALLIAVTVLTSMNQNDLNEIGITGAVENQVLKLAMLTQQAGLDGVVCSALEAALLKQNLPNHFLLVTPGIRPATSNLDDQSRVLTPTQALNMGASYLVIGRPITQAAQPLTALMQIYKEIAG